jgi:hypothetical protein
VAHTGSVASRVERAARSYVLGKFARAESHGHGPINLESRTETGKRQSGYRAVCSCSWSSTMRSSKKYALLAAVWHVTEVCDVLDQRKRLDGVEWSAAPPTRRLLHDFASVSVGDIPQTDGPTGQAPAATG